MIVKKNCRDKIYLTCSTITMNIQKLGSDTVYRLILLMSVLIPFAVVIPGQFPFVGMAFSFVLLSSLVYATLTKRTVFSTVLYAGALVFSALFIFRANPFILFLNTIALFYANALMILLSHEQKTFSVVTLFFSPVIVFFQSIKISQPLYYPKLKKAFSVHITKPEQILLSLAITIISLLIILPLLSSANPLFAHLVKTIGSYISIQAFIDFLSGETVIVYMFRLIIFGILFLLLPRIATFAHLYEPKNEKETAAGDGNTFLVLPKLIVSLVLFVFFVTQLQLYFSTEQTLLALGYTHSQYAREVFAQLSLVVLVVFALVYNDHTSSKLARASTLLLIIQAYFLTAMAFKSDFDYSSTFGFTFKRLWGFTGVFWITGAITLFLIHYLNRGKQVTFIKQAVLLSLITLIGVNIVNFDYLIYHFSKARTQKGDDQAYLTRVSPDANSYNQQLDLIMDQIHKNADNPGDQNFRIWIAARLIEQIERIEKKYDQFDIRTINLSELTIYAETDQETIARYKKEIEIAQEEVNKQFQIQNQSQSVPGTY